MHKDIVDYEWKGRLFYMNDVVPTLTIIVLSESDGGIEKAQNIAQSLVSYGFNALALSYFGAGSRILTATLVQRIIYAKKIENIKIICYDTNEDILGLLNGNLSWIKEHSPVKIEYKIITDNYITSQTNEYNNMLGAYSTSEKYYVVIGNPLYLRLDELLNKLCLCQIFAMVFLKHLTKWLFLEIV